MTSMAILFGILGLLVGLGSLWFTTEALKRMDQIQGVKVAKEPAVSEEVARLEYLTRTLEHRLGKLEMETQPAHRPSSAPVVVGKQTNPNFIPNIARSA